jgi:hypothetical protein
MFGYVTICEPELKGKDLRRYRAYYCGLCRMLKQRHGQLGQMTLSYDMTFLVILLTSLYEAESHKEVHRCLVHPLKKREMFQNEVMEYVSDMNVLLSYYHFEDDWKDEHQILGWMGMQGFRRKARRIEKAYPRKSKVICEQLHQLTVYEARQETSLDLVAGCFGRLMEELFVYHEDLWEERLRKMAHYLGKYIYLMDAYEDLEKDEKCGSYNPLRPLSQTADYEETINQILCMMVAEATAAFEELPCVFDVDLLRNILYDGIWSKYRKIRQQKREEESKNE